MPLFHDLTTAQLKQAVQIRETIEDLQKKLASLLGGPASTPKAKAGPSKGKRVMSAATKKRMAAAQQARRAKTKAKPAPAKTASKKSVAVEAAPKKRGTITPEGRARLAAAMKARWAARKKGAPAPNAPAQ